MERHSQVHLTESQRVMMSGAKMTCPDCKGTKHSVSRVVEWLFIENPEDPRAILGSESDLIFVKNKNSYYHAQHNLAFELKKSVHGLG